MTKKRARVVLEDGAVYVQLIENGRVVEKQLIVSKEMVDELQELYGGDFFQHLEAQVKTDVEKAGIKFSTKTRLQ